MKHYAKLLTIRYMEYAPIIKGWQKVKKRDKKQRKSTHLEGNQIGRVKSVKNYLAENDVPCLRSVMFNRNKMWYISRSERDSVMKRKSHDGVMWCAMRWWT